MNGGARSVAESTRKWARNTSYFLLALGFAGALTAALSSLIPDRLDVTTDSLGYPTRFNFNIFGQWYVFGLLAFVLPIGTLVTYTLLTRRQRRVWAQRSMPAPAPTPASAERHQDQSLSTALPQLVRLLVVGAVLGLELSIAVRNDTSSGLAVFGATAVIYIVTVLAIAVTVRALRPTRPSIWATAALVNSGATVLCVFGLYGVSRTTEVSIASTHSVRKLPWMPLGLAVPIAALAVGGLGLYLRRGRSAGRVWTAERWMILLVALPAAFFVLHARVPGALGPVGSFEEGQLLVGANQVLHGAFPWRDIILAHGIFNDSLLFMPGLVFVEVSRWGAWAGYYLLVEPVYWLLLYGLILYLTRGRWAYAGLFLGVVILGNSFLGGFFSQVGARFLPLPLVIIAFGLLLSRPTWTRAAAFTGGLLILVVLTPEALFLVPLAAGVLFLFEVSTREEAGTKRIRVGDFPRLLRCIVAGTVGCGLLALWLAWNGALGAFIFYFKTFVPAHILEGLPIENTHQQIFFAGMYVPIVLASVFLVAMSLALLWRRRPRTEDWVGMLLAAGTVFYYAKFLGRADQPHLFQFLAFTTPFLFYLLFRAVDGIQAWVSERDWRSPPWRWASRYAITGALLVGVFVPSVGDLSAAVRHVPNHFNPKVASTPSVTRVGYSVPSAVDPGLVSDLRAILLAVGGPRARVWDFTNSPAYMYFIERFDPPTRYDNVSIAIRSSTQQDVISELQRTQPDVIVYDGPTGLAKWDGLPNMVRHYDVSGWLLRHYRPVVSYFGNVIYASNSTAVSMAALQALPLAHPLDMTTDLYTDAVNACDWGYVPNFFSQQPSAGGSSQPLSIADAGRHEILTGRVTQGSTFDPAPVQVFATAHGAVIASGRIDQQLSVFPSGIGFGFELDVPLTNRSPSEVSAWVRVSDGTVRPLAAAGSNDAAAAAAGTVEATQVGWENRFTVPTNAARYHWLEVTDRSGSSVRPDTFTLSRTNDGSHGIFFSTRSNAPRPFDVRLDNCSQWTALPGTPAVLLHGQRQAGLELRLRA
jgi:hypothetical protein